MKMGIFHVVPSTLTHRMDPKYYLEEEGKKFAWRHLDEKPRTKFKMPEVVVLPARKRRV